MNQSFIPIVRLIRTGGIEAVLEFYRELGEEYYQEFIDILVFDAIILNEDHHFGIFGLLIDNHTNKIIAPAPIFDNGLSLLCYAMESDFGEESRYIETRQPATYTEFIEFVKPLMSHRQKDKVRKLLDFHFERKVRYELPNKRLKQLEKMIQKQARSFLD